MNWRMLAAVALIAVAASFAVYLIDREANDRQLDAAMANCEFAKADRIDNARAATAHAQYLEGVLAAQSVQEDVKQRARRAIQAWSESANQLRRRLYDCDKLVRDGDKVLDRDALLEARGEL